MNLYDIEYTTAPKKTKLVYKICMAIVFILGIGNVLPPHAGLITTGTDVAYYMNVTSLILAALISALSGYMGITNYGGASEDNRKVARDNNRLARKIDMTLTRTPDNRKPWWDFIVKIETMYNTVMDNAPLIQSRENTALPIWSAYKQKHQEVMDIEVSLDHQINVRGDTPPNNDWMTYQWYRLQT